MNAPDANSDGMSGPKRNLGGRPPRVRTPDEERQSPEPPRGRRDRKHVGAWHGVMLEACRKEKSLLGQVNYIFGRISLRTVHGRKREASENTLTKYAMDVRLAYADLSDLPIGRGISRVDQMKRKHVVALTRHWLEGREKPLSAATIRNRITALRIFLDRIGKPDVIPCDDDWHAVLRSKGIDPDRLRVATVAVVSKSWASRGINAHEKIEEIWADCEVVGAQLLLSLEFGPRVRESLSSTPFVDHTGEVMLFDKGTKGGRRRKVELAKDPVVRARQAAALNRAKAVAAKNPHGILARPRDKEPPQARNHFYYVVRKHGISRKDLGVVAHGLRHQYLHGTYERVSGLPAPVHNAVPVSEYRARIADVRAADHKVSSDAGHARESASLPYGSSLSTLTRRQRANVERLLPLFQERDDVDEAFCGFGAVEIWMHGRAAMGLDLNDGEPIGIMVLLQAFPADSTSVQALRQQLQAMTGLAIALSIAVNASNRPSGSLEIILPSQRRGPRGGQAATAGDAE